MVRRTIGMLSIVVFVFSLLSFSACSRSRIKDDELVDYDAQEEMRDEAIRRLDDEAITEEELEEARRKVAEMRAQEGIILVNVFFDFDDFSLDEESKTALAQNAAWLIDNAEREVIIEGHCDERGTSEYNLALGERRATSVKRYLVRLGVQDKQLSTISFGEERPADPASNEDAWAKNRRAEFVIQ